MATLFKSTAMMLTMVIMFASKLTAAEESLTAAEAWLQLVDKGQYDASWETASPRFQMVMPKPEWVAYLKSVRQPLGNLKTRTLDSQQDAQNPQNLPPGDYKIVLYSSAFDNKSSAKEFLTLVQGYDGKWRVLTYFINQN